MRITTKGRYALRAILQLARSNDDKPVSIKKIAEIEGLSPEFLEQIFFKLKKDGIISSVRGPGGGFLLKKKQEEISVQDIFKAVGEKVAMSPCLEPNHHEDPCDKIGSCLSRQVWVEANEKLSSFFKEITLTEIFKRYGDGVDLGSVL